MSGGDRDNPYPFTIAETKAILRLSIVEKMMRRHMAVDSEHWDIPYLAGYSEDGSKIFIDRDLKDWEWSGKAINPDQFLKLHEQTEKALIDAIHEAKGHDLMVLLACLRMKSPNDEIYYHTHGVATAVELYAVEQACGRAALAAYNRFMRQNVKRAEDERIRRVPRSLDMTPYTGSDEQDRRLRAAMKKVMN